MRSAFSLVLAIGLLTPAAVLADEEPLPASVAAELDSVAAICRDAGGSPMTEQAVKRADLNGDGSQDFVVDTGSVQCNGAASIYGDREKSVSVYAGEASGGATQSFAGSSYGVKLESGKLWLTVSGAQCGKGAAQDFASEAFCERPLAWNPSAKKFELAPVATVRMIE